MGGDHPEDEEDFYEEEMDVRLSPAQGRGECGWWAQALLEVSVRLLGGMHQMAGFFLCFQMFLCCLNREKLPKVPRAELSEHLQPLLSLRASIPCP